MNCFAIDTLGPVGRVQADSFGARDLGDVVAARHLSDARSATGPKPWGNSRTSSGVEKVEKCEGGTAETCKPIGARAWC
jgi:hypothetical protein